MKRFYWIVKNSQRVGPFGLEALQEKVDGGEFAQQDFVFYPGCKGLERLSEIEGISFGGKPPAASAAGPMPAAAPSLMDAPVITKSLPANSDFSRPTPVPESSPPPRARMPDPGALPNRLPNPAPQAEPRTVAPREGSPSEPLAMPGMSSMAETATPRVIALPPSEGEARKPTKLVSKRELGSQKDSTERLDKLLPEVPHSPSFQRESDKLEIDFSSIEAALNKPAPTGASVKIPAPTPVARPLASIADMAAQTPIVPPAPPAPEPETRAPLRQMPSPFMDELFDKQTMVVNAPPRRAREKRTADTQYAGVIKKPIPPAPEEKVKEEPREVLASVKYTELAKPAEAVPAVEPEFTNSLGMGFVQVANLPLGFGLWQVRVKEFRSFCERTGHDAGPKWRSPDFLQLEDNPVIFVSWVDATEFCKWLTALEREAGWIDQDQVYRLPTDVEWSAAIGLRNEPGKTPQERNGRIPGVFPWGKQWPPPPRVGNFADESAARRFGWEPVAEGYDDGQVYTSKVGLFHAGATNLYDMAGNVWEWVDDWYDSEQTLRTLRGGSWVTNRMEDLYSCARDYDLPEARRGKNGFRVVLAGE